MLDTSRWVHLGADAGEVRVSYSSGKLCLPAGCFVFIELSPPGSVWRCAHEVAAVAQAPQRVPGQAQRFEPILFFWGKKLGNNW